MSSDAGDISDILSQGDIDALMNMGSSSGGGGGDEVGVVFRSNGERFPKDQKVKINVCDFRNPVFLTESEMRQVRIRHESFIHYMAARLSMFIRMDVGLKMSKLHTMSFTEFTETIASPTFINLFRVGGLNGVGVMSINPRLAMTLVNRMLGGKGHSVTDERYLTDIEMALIEDAVRLMLQEWCSQWEEMDGLAPTIVGRENNGRFLQTSSHDAVTLVLDIEATMGDCCEGIQIGVPYAMIDPMIKAMKQSNKDMTRNATARQKKKWLPTYSSINVPLVAEWDAFDITVGDILRLRKGDILQMPSSILAETKIRMNGVTRFIGEVGVENDHVAVQIIEQVKEIKENQL